MQRKIMVVAISSVIAALGNYAVAQNVQSTTLGQNQNQFTQPAPSGQEERVVIGNVDQGNFETPNQLANPYGSTQVSETENINYGGVNTIDGNRMILPPNQVEGYPQQVTPTSLPTGLPGQSGGREMEQVQATINILNTPDDRIREINKDMYQKGRVLNETPVAPPKAVNMLLTASVSPGAVPPVVRLSKNRATAIILTDINGQPWPIVNYDGLSTEDFTVKRLDNAAPDGYVLSVTPRGAFVSGNLVLILKGLASPLSLDFVSAQKEFDAKADIRVQASGPNTQYSTLSLPDGIDTSLLSLLQGVAPDGAKQLTVNGNAAQAWLARDGKMYLRTRHKIMSPAFENVSSSPDGTYAYKMMAVPVVLYKAEAGRYGEFNITGF